MRGLVEALNRLATSETSRASVIATKKEDCRMSDSFSGCKHNPTRNRVAFEALKDIAISNYVPESNEETETYILDGVYSVKNGVGNYIIKVKDIYSSV